MNFIQSIRRFNQKSTGWKSAFKIQEAQGAIVKKLFEKSGLEIKMTCGACPEQYDVFRDGVQIAYMRLRHGYFQVQSPDSEGEYIYTSNTIGDGIFESNERLIELNNAKKSILKQ